MKPQIIDRANSKDRKFYEGKKMNTWLDLIFIEFILR